MTIKDLVWKVQPESCHRRCASKSQVEIKAQIVALPAGKFTDVHSYEVSSPQSCASVALGFMTEHAEEVEDMEAQGMGRTKQ